MSRIRNIACLCGEVRLELKGDPFLVSECLCNSCRSAAKRLSELPGARTILTEYGATPCAEYRKDHVRFLSGHEYLGAFKLSAEAGSRRVVANCCNTPTFLELKGAHWLSIYLHLWPPNARPKAEMRTMVGDLSDASGLSRDIPNLKAHSVLFYMKIFRAWISMGFRNPNIEIVGKIDA